MLSKTSLFFCTWSQRGKRVRLVSWFSLRRLYLYTSPRFLNKSSTWKTLLFVFLFSLLDSVAVCVLLRSEMAANKVSICFALVFVFCLIHSAYSEEKCLDGLYHKKSPGPQVGDYKACEPWKNKTCCTAEFTVELVANQTRTLYNHSWHRCGQLSKKCEKFWMEQVRLWIVWPSEALDQACTRAPILNTPNVNHCLEIKCYWF